MAMKYIVKMCFLSSLPSNLLLMIIRRSFTTHTFIFQLKNYLVNCHLAILNKIYVLFLEICFGFLCILCWCVHYK